MRLYIVCLFCLAVGLLLNFGDAKPEPGMLTSIARRAGRGLGRGALRLVSTLASLGRNIGRLGSSLGRGASRLSNSRIIQRLSRYASMNRLDIFSGVVFGLPFVSGSVWVLTQTVEGNRVREDYIQFVDGVQFFYCQIEPITSNLVNQHQVLSRGELNVEAAKVEDLFVSFVNTIKNDVKNFDGSSGAIQLSSCSQSRFRRGSSYYPSEFNPTTRTAVRQIAAFDMTPSGSTVGQQLDFLRNHMALFPYDENDSSKPFLVVLNAIRTWAVKVGRRVTEWNRQLCLANALRGDGMDAVTC